MADTIQSLPANPQAEKRDKDEKDFRKAAKTLLADGLSRSWLADLVELQHNEMHGANIAAAQSKDKTPPPYPLLAG